MIYRVASELRENVLVALGTIWAHKLRSSLTLLGVVVGTMTVIAIGSILTGMNARITEMTEQLGPSLMIISKWDQIGIRFRRPSQSERTRKNLTPEDAEAIGGLSSVVGASPQMRMGRMGPMGSDFTVKYRGTEFANPFVLGVWANYPELRSVLIKEGRFFSEDEEKRKLEVAVVAEVVADTLFGGLQAVGKEIEIDGRTFHVIGVTKRGVGGLFGGDGFDDRFIWVPFGTLAKMHPEITDINIVAKAQQGSLSRAFDQVIDTLRRRRGVASSEPNDFSISTPDAIFETVRDMTAVTAMIVIPICLFALMVGGVGVMNIMLVSVTERTKEIGVRRAVGARRFDITWQFLVEAMALTGMGGIIGIAAGWLISTTVHALIPAIPSSVPLWSVLLGFGGSVGIGLVFGLWPAMKAARLDPIEALRYE
jgi:putative ABC transport system permease protein